MADFQLETSSLSNFQGTNREIFFDRFPTSQSTEDMLGLGRSLFTSALWPEGHLKQKQYSYSGKHKLNAVEPCLLELQL